MSKNSIQNLRNSIHSKFSKIDNDIIKKDLEYINGVKKSILFMSSESHKLELFNTFFKNKYNIFLAHTIDSTTDILKKEIIDILISENYDLIIKSMSYNKSKNILISDKIKDNNLIVLDNFDINNLK